MPVDNESQNSAAVRQFLAGQTASIAQLSQGLSGGAVFKCKTEDAEFALKRWPDGTATQRVDEVHAVQRAASKSLDLVPDLICWSPSRYRLTLDGLHFELSTWMPGEAFVDDGNLGKHDEFVYRGAAAIARFHRATECLGQSTAVAPAVIRRLDRLAELQYLVPVAIKFRNRLTAAIRQAGDRLAADWRRLHDESEAILRAWESRPVRLQWVLRDVHLEHILFENRQFGANVSGIVDFDAVNRDTVAADLARWTGSFVDLAGYQSTIWNAVVDGYRSQRTISTCEVELAGAIEKASWYIHLANWVVWLALEQRNFSGRFVTIEQRVNRLLRRSEVRNTD